MGNNTSCKANEPGAYAGTDALGRVLPSAAQAPQRAGKKVGLFYFLWQGQHGTQGPFDNSVISKKPGATDSEEAWMAAGGSERMVFHHWGEPLFGYYTSDDEWVLRRHVEMLTDAGVDFLVFDTTNHTTYSAQALKLFKYLDEYQKQGWKVPQAAFYTNTEPGETVNWIYHEVYEAHPEYEGLWFRWTDGKPLIIGDIDDPKLEPAPRGFFHFKPNQWPNEPRKDDGFPWIEFERLLTPASVYGKPGEPSVMNVSIAQHCNTVRFSSTAWYGGNDHSRNWHDGANDQSPGAVLHGYNFAEQWDFAMEQDPDIVFVTGWNEWIAMRLNPVPGEPVVFCDCADIDNSRDSEPMKGGFGDNYYMQLIAGIRRFKGLPEQHAAGSAAASIDPAGPLDQWDSAAITAVYHDFRGDTAHRDSIGYGGIHYRNDTGRNDFVCAKAAQDSENLYFYAETAAPVTAPADHWMSLLLNTGAGEGWNGYHYIVNRVAPENGKAVVEKSTGGWNWKQAGEAGLRVEGNRLMLVLPKALLGLPCGERLPAPIAFKWADNYQPDDIYSFYTDGDAAPIGRLNYVFEG